jgi:hypothetical protein
MEITADVVDPKEMNCELQQRLGEELVEQERNAALAERDWYGVLVQSCSPRVMKPVHRVVMLHIMFPRKLSSKNFPAKIDTFRHMPETFKSFQNF